METWLQITEDYLGIPIKATIGEKQKEICLEISGRDQKIYEFSVPAGNGKTFDYFAWLPVRDYVGKELCLKGEFCPDFLNAVIQDSKPKQPPLIRPELHFTAERGWINDPNGLVFHEGEYHLFYQYNPMDIVWENMSWGHAVSHDLIHWSYRDPALYPDEFGTVYSGCGIVNEKGLLGLPKDTLLFFYTAAAEENRWSEGKKFVQRLAYSLDGGKTLIKHPDIQVDYMESGNRDPKVFYHEETKCYVMVLFLLEHDFAVFTSADLKNWQKTQRLTLEKAWECPDLFRLAADDGTEQWVFWSADGFYFIGEFDGAHFTPKSRRKEAYQTDIPYAAQTYFGINGRVISVAWLRTKHEGHFYTGAMAIPRELSLVRCSESEADYRMRLSPVKEFSKLWEPWIFQDMTNGCLKWDPKGSPYCLKLNWQDEFDKKVTPGVCRLKLGEEMWEFDRSLGRITCRDHSCLLPLGETLTELTVIADRGIVEITGNCDIIYLVYETTDYQLTASVTYEGDKVTLQTARKKSGN